MMDDEWDGGWSQMREDAERMCREMKKRFWGLEPNALYGVHYDNNGDTLWDIHQVIRHQLWKDNPNRQQFTVDASEAHQFGDEPLANIKRLKEGE